MAELESSAKQAKTNFKLVKTIRQTNQSLVLCKPETGRTHQIRKHLAQLGYPISNDVIYKDPLFVELTRAVKAVTKNDNAKDYGDVERLFGQLQEKVQVNMRELQLDGVCKECGTPEYRDQTPESLMIYLHAWRYVQGDVKYETALPAWANF